MYAVFMLHAEEIFPKLAKKYHGTVIKLFKSKFSAQWWIWERICRNGFGHVSRDGTSYCLGSPGDDSQRFDEMSEAIDEFQSGFGATQFFHYYRVVE